MARHRASRVGSSRSARRRSTRSRRTTPDRRAPRAPLTILQINDVYTTVPIDGVGGLARVATLKKQLAAAGRTPLLIIAGDFLSPSVASTVFKGEQMVAALNAAGLDLATLGNHEFDFGIGRPAPAHGGVEMAVGRLERHRRDDRPAVRRRPSRTSSRRSGR